MHCFWAAKAAGVIGLSKMDISGLSPDGLQANRNRYNTISAHVRMETSWVRGWNIARPGDLKLYRGMKSDVTPPTVLASIETLVQRNTSG